MVICGGNSDGVPEGQYYSDWSASNVTICSDLITEIWSRYGTEYGDRIAGWYYVNEIWNMDAAGNGTDSRTYAKMIEANIHATVQAVEQSCPKSRFSSVRSTILTYSHHRNTRRF